MTYKLRRSGAWQCITGIILFFVLFGFNLFAIFGYNGETLLPDNTSSAQKLTTKFPRFVTLEANASVSSSALELKYFLWEGSVFFSIKGRIAKRN